MKFIARVDGFHLLEMLIVLAMIAVTTHWAYGNYRFAVAIERRQEAIREIFYCSSALEDYALTFFSYAEVSLQKLHMQPLVAGNSYYLQIDLTDAHHYVITARPLGMQADIDRDCGTLIFSSTGEKGVTGPGGWGHCWS